VTAAPLGEGSRRGCGGAEGVQLSVGGVWRGVCWTMGVLIGVIGWGLPAVSGFGRAALGEEVGLPLVIVGNVLVGAGGVASAEEEVSATSGFRDVRAAAAGRGDGRRGDEMFGTGDGTACGALMGVVLVRAGCAGGAFLTRPLGADRAGAMACRGTTGVVLDGAGGGVVFATAGAGGSGAPAGGLLSLPQR
jgi:hypothetical protein